MLKMARALRHSSAQSPDSGCDATLDDSRISVVLCACASTELSWRRYREDERSLLSGHAARCSVFHHLEDEHQLVYQLPM